MSDRNTLVLQSFTRKRFGERALRGRTALSALFSVVFMSFAAPLFAQNTGEQNTGGWYDPDKAAKFNAMNAHWGPGGSLASNLGDGLLGDAGGVRSALADYGIAGYLFIDGTNWQNLLNSPTKTDGSQMYIGQHFTAEASYGFFATYDVGRVGLPGAQIVLDGGCSVSNYLSAYPRGCRFMEVSFYDSFFRGRVELSAGMLRNDVEYADTYVGSSTNTGAFGPQSILPVQSGLSQNPATAPGLNVTYHLNADWYEKIGVQRSESPQGLVQEYTFFNPHGLTFSEPLSKPLLIDEVGYRTTASPDQLSTYIRMGGLYNWTQYKDYRTGGTSQNWNVYLLGDQQLTQPEPGRSYRGWYGGFTVMESPAKVNVFRSDDEARIYDIGPFKSRPFDQFNIVGTYRTFSQDARQYYIDLGTYPPQKNTTSVTMGYAFKAAHGTYLTVNLAYVNHPSFITAPGEGQDLNFIFNYIILL
jgi:porin